MFEVSKKRNTPCLADAPMHHLIVLQRGDLPLHPHLRVEVGDELLRLDVHPGVLAVLLFHGAEVRAARSHHRPLEQLLLRAIVEVLDAVLARPGTVAVPDAARDPLARVAEEVAVATVVVGGVRDGGGDAGDEAEHERGGGAEPERRSLVDGELALTVAQPVAAPAAPQGLEQAETVHDDSLPRPERRQPQQPPRPPSYRRPSRRLRRRRCHCSAVYQNGSLPCCLLQCCSAVSLLLPR
uniref:Uncharacterized protein n=1 Tax=Triticum urartu TaxID=4572 RepID=A0A8R7U9X6_TRIUA